ncbi:hypothetical protein K474DRAFT_1707575 [Panus rudis PR-1116 ss-1]|nr:hypothetical protein K474DRAFT_1707575 [Panus rudis PR-1116 ss-1]
MRFSATVLIVLSCAAFSLGAVLTRSAELCPGARVLKTERVGEAEFKTFECPDTSPAGARKPKVDVPSTSISSKNFTAALVPRQFQNCAGGAADAECQCAVLCNLDFCTGGRAVAPLQSDCQNLANELFVPGSFFVPANQGVSATLGSCEAVWINWATSELEFCFENFANDITAQYTNCVIVAGGGQGGCEADNFLWFMEFLVPGNTIVAP